MKKFQVCFGLNPKCTSISAFSFVELLITLIIISLLLAAFMPLITKKLKASDITVGSFGKGDIVNTLFERQVTKEDCAKYDAIFIPAGMNGGTRNLCVTKYNMGDKELPLAKSVKKLSAGNECPARNNGNCCFEGNTSSGCGNDGNGESNYSGCNRTVCQWQAANASCASYAPNEENEGRWRLPKKDEISSWKDNLAGINDNKGIEGLQLCDKNSSDNGSVKCPSNNSENTYEPYRIWSLTSESDKQYFSGVLENGTMNALEASYEKTGSTRCVLDSVEVKMSEIEGGIGNPSNDPFYGEPKDQADCDKITAIFIDKKYSGSNRNICVSKYNVGDIGPDGFGPPIPKNYEKYIMSTGQRCTYDGYCCWKGNVSPTCGIDGNEGANYSGCNRTVCQWHVANEACRTYTAFGATKAGAWRLPRSSELAVWAPNLPYINNNKGSAGLQLCSHNKLAGLVQCTNGGVCIGAANTNGCYTYHNWTETPASTENFYNYYTTSTTVMTVTNYVYTAALSARCVYDGITTAENNDDLSNYDDSNAPPDEPKSQADCDKLIAIFVHKKYAGGGRNLCVSKYNVGDSGPSGSGPTIPSAYNNYVMNAGQSCPYGGYCCWKGNVSPTCGITGNAGADYSGCNRTVCQWHVANESCQNWTVNGKTQKGAWRLPSQAEFSSIANNLPYINNNKGKDGLQLCSHYRLAGLVQCTNGSACIGAANTNGCYTYHNWTETPASTENFYNFYTTSPTAMTVTNYVYTAALSARCVYDGTVRKFEEVTDYDDSNAPTDEPKSQEECNKFNAIFIHKKYAGEGRNVCVTKYNVGDIGPGGAGPKIPDEYKQYYLNTGQGCGKAGYCCWKGTTSPTCGIVGNAGADYSGCGRTVCQWNVANAACKAHTANGKTPAGYWRLPRSSELNNWSINLPYINNNKGSAGLQLCSHYRLAGLVQCANGSVCIGAANTNGCYTYHNWTETNAGGSNYYNYYTTSPTAMTTTSYAYTAALSARCVYDGLNYSEN